VFVTRIPAVALGTNCYVLAPSRGEECVIVDPGVAVADTLAETLSEHGLRPAGVLLTHGHFDHVWSAGAVCGAHGVAAHLHADDVYRLVDPLATVDAELRWMLEQQFGSVGAWSAPEDTMPLVDGQELTMAGLHLRVIHAPGHTEGSALYSLPEPPDGTDASSTVLTGDVLFAGSVGRTDLSGSDHRAMLRSLREKVLTLEDGAAVLPGHGPATTIARERVTNPYLAGASRDV
jgi:hydroxyacylglutathione hydrolase